MRVTGGWESNTRLKLGEQMEKKGGGWGYFLQLSKQRTRGRLAKTQCRRIKHRRDLPGDLC